MATKAEMLKRYLEIKPEIEGLYKKIELLEVEATSLETALTSESPAQSPLPMPEKRMQHREFRVDKNAIPNTLALVDQWRTNNGRLDKVFAKEIAAAMKCSIGAATIRLREIAKRRPLEYKFDTREGAAICFAPRISVATIQK